jgi:hypothetical protein
MKEQGLEVLGRGRRTSEFQGAQGKLTEDPVIASKDLEGVCCRIWARERVRFRGRDAGPRGGVMERLRPVLVLQSVVLLKDGLLAL